MFKTLGKITCFLLVAFLINFNMASADVKETNAVTVTANRVEQNIMDVPMSLSVVDEKELKRNPNSSVADQLAEIPGITVEDSSMAGGKRVSIRGEGSARVLIMINGVRISEQKSMTGAAILMNTSDIERIEVIKGPASVLYGSEAIGGVVNIITKKGGDKIVGFSQRFTLDSSNNSIEPNSSLFGNYKGFNYRFSASGLNASDRKIPDGSLDNTKYRQRNYSGQLGYQWDNGEFTIRGDRYKSKIELPGYFQMTGKTSFDMEMDLPKWQRETISANLVLKNLSGNLAKVTVQAYDQKMDKYFDNFMVIDPPGPQKISNTIKTHNDQKSRGGFLQTEWLLFDKHYLTAGLDYNKDDLQADSFNKTTSMVPNRKTRPISWMERERINNYNYDASLSTWGLFAQDEWDVIDDLKIIAGLRQTWVNSEMSSSNDPLSIIDKKKDNNLVANFGLVYSGFENMSLRAQFSQGYRFPNINQLYIGTAHGSNQFTYSNPNLKPEESNNYEIGLRYENEKLSIDTAVYYADAKNYITTLTSPTRQEYVNMDKAKTIGFEFGAQYDFADFSPYARFNYMRRKIVERNFSTYNSGITPFTGQVGIKWEKDINDYQLLFTDLNLDWASKWKQSKLNRSTNIVKTSENPSWKTMNFTVGLESEGDSGIKYDASLSFRNILNKSYKRGSSDLIEPGFHVVMTFGAEF